MRLFMARILGFLKQTFISERLNRDSNLSANFKVKEFLHPNTEWHHLTKGQQLNIRRLVGRLERLRILFNKPFVINTSGRDNAGFRTVEQNENMFDRNGNPIEPKKNSYHLKGMAADVAVIGGDLRRIAMTAQDLFGGVILYEDNNFIHLDIRDLEGRKWHPKF